MDCITMLHFLGAMSHEPITVYILMYITSQHGCGTIVKGFDLYRLHRDTALHFLGAMSHDKPDSCPQMHIYTLCSLLSEVLCPEISKDASWGRRSVSFLPFECILQLERSIFEEQISIQLQHKMYNAGALKTSTLHYVAIQSIRDFKSFQK